MSWNKEYKIPKMIKKAELAYVAGLIDGEGCITINKQAAGKAGRVNPSHRLYLKVTIGQRFIAVWLRDTFKVGSVHKQEHKGRDWNPGYVWWVSARQAVAVLRALRPYLKIKAKEADIAFEFAETYWQRGSSKRLSPEVVKKREALCRRMERAKPSYRFRAKKNH